MFRGLAMVTGRLPSPHAVDRQDGDQPRIAFRRQCQREGGVVVEAVPAAGTLPPAAAAAVFDAFRHVQRVPHLIGQTLSGNCAERMAGLGRVCGVRRTDSDLRQVGS